MNVNSEKPENPKTTGGEKPRSIGTVTSAEKWKLVGSGQITADSVAEESVARQWGPDVALRQEDGDVHSERRERGYEPGVSDGDVQKPSSAMWRTDEKRNLVQLGPTRTTSSRTSGPRRRSR